MMGLLARREHSRLELLQKMTIKGFDKVLINENVDDFINRDWQSDLRYSEMLVRSRIMKQHGPVKISIELRQKGLPPDLIAKSMAIDTNWSELALAALNKKFPAIAANQAERSKQYRFLQTRGFNHQQIKWAMKDQQALENTINSF